MVIGGTISILAVIFIGAAVGAGELVARYRDAPLKAASSPSGIIYIGINALASVVALLLIDKFKWNFGIEDPDARFATQLLVAGFGAMALFRSSLFIVRVGNSDVAVGPSGFLQIILAAADRGVDRGQAKSRADTVAEIMKDVDFTKARLELPMTCFALLQNVPGEEQQAVSREIKQIAEADVSHHAKVLSLGLTLINVVGELSLRAAVRALGQQIKFEESPGGG